MQNYRPFFNRKLPKLSKLSAIFQQKIIIYHWQFQILSTFSTENSIENMSPCRRAGGRRPRDRPSEIHHFECEIHHFECEIHHFEQQIVYSHLLHCVASAARLRLVRREAHR